MRKCVRAARGHFHRAAEPAPSSTLCNGRRGRTAQHWGSSPLVAPLPSSDHRAYCRAPPSHACGFAENQCAVYTDALMMARLPEWWGSRHAERMGDTTTSAFASRLTIMGGFRVDDGRYHYLDQQARRLASLACAAACRPCWTTVGASPSSPPTSTPPNRPSAAPSLSTRSTSHPAASSSPASASAPLSSAPPPGSPNSALPGCVPIWWTAWSPGRGRWRRWRASSARRPVPCGACWTSMRFGGWRRPGGSTRRRSSKAGHRSRRARSSSGGRHAWPNLGSPRWRSTCGIDTSGGAGRCGGCATSSGGAWLAAPAAGPAWTAILSIQGGGGAFRADGGRVGGSYRSR
jgi:hypothetical protein